MKRDSETRKKKFSLSIVDFINGKKPLNNDAIIG